MTLEEMKKKDGYDGMSDEDKEAYDEKMKKCGMMKSEGEGISEDDLEKSLKDLEGMGKSDSKSRKEILLEKAQTTELEKSEKEELMQLMGMGAAAVEEPEPSLAEDVTKGLKENEELNKALDVSDFLREHNNELVKSLEAVCERLEKSDNRQSDFNMLLAKSVAKIGRLAQDIDTRLSALEGKPAHAPKSQGAAALNKSFAGNPPAGDQLSKSQIQETVNQMFRESCDKGNNGFWNSIDLGVAASRYEQFNEISPQLMAEVKQRNAAVN